MTESTPKTAKSFAPGLMAGGTMMAAVNQFIKLVDLVERFLKVKILTANLNRA